MSFIAKLKDSFNGLLKFLRDVRTELRKVVWPTRKQTINYTLVVLVAVFLVTVLLSVTDAAFNVVIRRLLGI
jgi:preprotein translocase subunit SecE